MGQAKIRMKQPSTNDQSFEAEADKKLVAQALFDRTELPVIRQRGETALFRLLPIASGDTGQSNVVALFLLGLYDGQRFPFDLTELRRLDRQLLVDCLSLLEMDAYAQREVHQFVEDGSAVFEVMASRLS